MGSYRSSLEASPSALPGGRDSRELCPAGIFSAPIHAVTSLPGWLAPFFSGNLRCCYESAFSSWLQQEQ